MNIVDLHCDTIYKITKEKDIELRKNNLAIDLEKMKKSSYLAQFFALFIDLDEDHNAFNRAMDMLNEFYRQVEKNTHDIAIARNYDELMKNGKEKKISAFLTIEEGEAVEGSIRNLRNFYDLGVRLITLTWNHENAIGYPNYEFKYANEGLKTFGIEMVEEMNNLGMIIDVSHLSDGGFWDVVKYSNTPFVASHSNSREVCNHSRNLTDDMISTLSEKGGIMGINFEKSFLEESGEYSRVEAMVKHIKHIYNVGGIDILSIGSDFDGIDPENLEIGNAAEMYKLIEGLEKSGFKPSQIDKITHENAIRLIKDVL